MAHNGAAPLKESERVMPRPRLLPDPDVIRKLNTEHGWTLREVGEHYKVSVSAAQKALRRAELVGPLVTYREVVPWKVAIRFADTAVMHHLRTMAQLQKVREVPAVAKRLLHEWLQYLENNRLVLDYSPDCPPTRHVPWVVFGTVPAGPETDPSTVTPQALAIR